MKKDNIDIYTPLEEEIRDIIENGKPKQQATLLIRHTLANFLLRDALETPILNDEQEKALTNILTKPDAWRQYIALYKKSRVIERAIDLVGRRMSNAEITLTQLKYSLMMVDQIEAAEELANTLLDLIPSKEKRLEQIALMSQTTGFYKSSLKADEEGYLIIDPSEDWKEFIYGKGNKNKELLSLMRDIRLLRDTAQARITSFFSVSAALKRVVNKIRIPFADIYLATLDLYEKHIKDLKPRNGKYNFIDLRFRITNEIQAVPYTEARREELSRELDYFNFEYLPDGEEIGSWYEQFIDDWSDLVGREY